MLSIYLIAALTLVSEV